MTGNGFPDQHWRTLLFVALWPLWMLWYIPMGIGLLLEETMFSVLAPVLILAPVGLLLIAFLAGLWGLVADARALKRHPDRGWSPWWPAYLVAALLVSVVFVAPVYVYRRWRKTGRPNRADVKRKLSLQGLVIPWY